MRRLKRFWFRFERSEKPSALNLGCGVTAYDYNDALALLRENVFFGSGGIPKITEYIEGIDVATLDTKHILPNLGVVASRGIWFPMGYQK